jgi:hypothetical protein
MFSFGYYQPCLNLFRYIRGKGPEQELVTVHLELCRTLEAYNHNQVGHENNQVENVLYCSYAGTMASTNR